MRSGRHATLMQRTGGFYRQLFERQTSELARGGQSLDQPELEDVAAH
jgi:hypothetical protein